VPTRPLSHLVRGDHLRIGGEFGEGATLILDDSTKDGQTLDALLRVQGSLEIGGHVGYSDLEVSGTLHVQGDATFEGRVFGPDPLTDPELATRGYVLAAIAAITQGTTIHLMEPVVGPLDGSNKDFTMPGGKKYIHGKVSLVFNATLLDSTDFTEDADQITVHMNEAPRSTDSLFCIFVEAI
jgi:hypothetical protein